MKVLFLDHDGVICLSNNWGSRIKKWSKYRSANPHSSKYFDDAPVEIRFDNFDKKAVKVLNEILESTGVEIVVSSDWRIHSTLQEMGDYYVHQGIIKRPIGYTKNSLPGDLPFFDMATDLEETRSYEILQWLKDHPQVTSWVAVDDLDMSVRYDDVGGYKWGLRNFVLTKRQNEGIKQSGIKEKIIECLS